jgi:N-acetylmuramoyl-L-alanine amidase
MNRVPMRAALISAMTIVALGPALASERTPGTATVVYAQGTAVRGSATVSRGSIVRTKGSRRLIVVDAGHGGTDPGMRGRLPSGAPVFEKQITLGVALELANALRDRGFDVLLTRSRDTLIALHDRGRIANHARADLFLSIHVNAPGDRWPNPTGARGFETYFLDEARTEDEARVAAMENDAVRFEVNGDLPANDALSFIMKDMAQNEYLRESASLAEVVQQTLGREHPGPDRGVKQANFAVLRNSFMPGVLIETGFGTNRSEAGWLASTSGQRSLATMIADATVEYFARYDRRVQAARQ